MEFIDLHAQLRRIRGDVDARIGRVLDHCRFLMGPEIDELESVLSDRLDGRHVVTCASGTDALLISLMALDIGPGDSVLCPAFTFPATAEAVLLSGAQPVFIDIGPETMTMDPDHLEGTLVRLARMRDQPRPKAVVPVDIFGYPADYDEISEIAARYGISVISDAAQSFGSAYKGRPIGGASAITCTSFFPAKGLGAYGDGGAVITPDAELAELARAIRHHGQFPGRPSATRLGFTGRLDSIQAAVLLAKLEVFDRELDRRREIANRYLEAMGDCFVLPPRPEGSTQSAWSVFTVRTPNRNRIIRALQRSDVPTRIYYDAPVHHLPVFSNDTYRVLGLEVTERVCQEVMSLPIHPYLTDSDVDQVIESVHAAGREAADDCSARTPRPTPFQSKARSRSPEGSDHGHQAKV